MKDFNTFIGKALIKTIIVYSVITMLNLKDLINTGIEILDSFLTDMFFILLIAFAGFVYFQYREEYDK